LAAAFAQVPHPELSDIILRIPLARAANDVTGPGGSVLNAQPSLFEPYVLPLETSPPIDYHEYESQLYQKHNILLLPLQPERQSNLWRDFNSWFKSRS
jgi:hypothetical protein